MNPPKVTEEDYIHPIPHIFFIFIFNILRGI
jgi:hypothetical protein